MERRPEEQANARFVRQESRPDTAWTEVETRHRKRRLLEAGAEPGVSAKGSTKRKLPAAPFVERGGRSAPNGGV